MPTKNNFALGLLCAVASFSAAAQTAPVAPTAAGKAKPGFSLELRDAILAQRWKEARPQLEALAATGDLTANVALGSLLVRGFDGEKNAKRGQKLLETAAERGSGAARRLLAQFFFKGDLNNGTPQYSKAWNYIYPMAQADDPMGLYLAGKIIRDGLLGSPNESVGRDMILQAATRGWPEAQQELSGVANLNLNTESGGTDEKDVPLSTMDVLSRSAKKGNTDSIWQLGLIHLYGIGVNADMAKAKLWFDKGKAKGDTAALVVSSYLANDGKSAPALAAALKKSTARTGVGYSIIARQLWAGRGAAIDLDRSAYYALIGGYLGATDTFEIIADLQKKMTPESFAAAETKFRAWRSENLPAQL